MHFQESTNMLSMENKVAWGFNYIVYQVCTSQHSKMNYMAYKGRQAWDKACHGHENYDDEQWINKTKFKSKHKT